MTVDLLIAGLAARQNNHVTRSQLLGIGFSSGAIAHRLKLGRLFAVHAGVYSVGRPPITPVERAAAAVLACGECAALDSFSAAALWGWWKWWPDRVHVLVPQYRRPKGIYVHRSTPLLLPRDFRTHHAIRVTSPARTVLECAPSLDDAHRRRLVNDARLARGPGQLTMAALADVLARFPHHPGAPLLMWFIEADPQEPTRSWFEDMLPGFCTHYRLPQAETNVFVAGHRVDALFRRERVILELDGYDPHSGRTAFETDRDRDADTLAAGCVTVRITPERLKRTPDREAARLHVILGSRRRELGLEAA